MNQNELKRLLDASDDAIRVLNLLLENGELRDYDDELANRVEDAKEIIRSWQAVMGPVIKRIFQVHYD